MGVPNEQIRLRAPLLSAMIDCPAPIADDLRTLLTDLVAADDGPCDRVIEVADLGSGEFSLDVDGRPVMRRAVRSTLVDAVVSRLNRLAVEDRDDWLHLHAATVTRDDAAIVLVGDTGAGKSTICAHLAGAGWNYVTDEVTAVSAEPAVVGLPKPMTLKPGTREQLPHLHAWHHPTPDGDLTTTGPHAGEAVRSYLVASSIGEVDRQARSPALLVILDPSLSASTPSPSPVECVVPLLQQTFDLRRTGAANGLRIAAEVAARSRRLRLARSSLATMTDAIERALAAPAPTHTVTWLEPPSGEPPPDALRWGTQIRGVRIDAGIALHHLGTGAVIALEDVAPELWQALADGASRSQVAARLEAAYPDAPAGAVRADTDPVIDELLAGGWLTKR